MGNGLSNNPTISNDLEHNIWIGIHSRAEDVTLSRTWKLGASGTVGCGNKVKTQNEARTQNEDKDVKANREADFGINAEITPNVSYENQKVVKFKEGDERPVFEAQIQLHNHPGFHLVGPGLNIDIKDYQIISQLQKMPELQRRN
eukprot:GHVP01026499.1.p1 GENE.GHVP01026499.1~~GHVP01026499.1.p1  ORF type:complete len:159 (-),score=25.95 GHVP01026499.1:318-752(-)